MRYKIYHRCSCMQKLSRIVSFYQATATCASTRIVEDYKSKCRSHRSRELLERVRKKSEMRSRNIIVPLYCLLCVAFHSCSRSRTHPSTRSRRARNSALEIYLHFDEAPSYPRYFLRKHKSPVGIVY